MTKQAKQKFVYTYNNYIRQAVPVKNAESQVRKKLDGGYENKFFTGVNYVVIDLSFKELNHAERFDQQTCEQSTN